MTRKRMLILGGSLLLAAAAITTVLLTRDDGSDVVVASTTTTSTTATTSTTLPPVTAPLTGLPVDDPAVLDRPALIVKIDNVDAYARPQNGLVEADVVYEEQVEGGVSRFAVIFHSTDADSIGPVRSARSTDIAIAAPLPRPLFGFSGANAVFLEAILAAPLVELSYDYHPELYTRRDDRRAPDNIFTPTSALWTQTPADAEAPGPLFVYRAEGESLLATAEPATSVSYAFGGSGSIGEFTWDEDRERWVRVQNGTPHVDENDEQIAPANVIVQFVEYVDTGHIDLAGTPVPEAQLVGEGDAWVFTDGHVVEARWSREAVDQVTSYVDSAGEPIGLTPGQTWVVLSPPGRAEYVAG